MHINIYVHILYIFGEGNRGEKCVLEGIEKGTEMRANNFDVGA